MIKLSSIDKDGKVLFTDGKTIREGTEKECLFYGFRYINGSCYVFNNNKIEKNIGNINLGKANIINGLQNTSIGKANIINTNNNTVIGDLNKVTDEGANCTVFGYRGHATRYSEVVTSNSTKLGRAQVVTLLYEGQTTDNNDTEIFIGGVSNKRLTVKGDTKTMIGGSFRAVGVRTDIGIECAHLYGHFSFKHDATTLSHVATSYSTHKTAGVNLWSVDFTAVAGSPDYIKVEVNGETGATVEWTMSIELTEMRI